MKTSKKPLLTSAMSLLICFSMLIGVTFAWFTDSAASGVNKIVAGNLDIEVEYNVRNSDGTLGADWQPLQDSQSLFSGSLWEPGHTEYAVIRIKNAGTLALKYQVKVDVVAETGSINVEGRQFKLSDYLKYGVKFGTAEPSFNRADAVDLANTALGAYASDARNLEANTGYDYMVLAITMPTSVGNAANYDKAYNAPSIDLGITVLATQKASESDSFGSDYDQNAQYPLPTFTSTSNASFPVQNDATLALGAAQVEVSLNANTSTGNTVNVGSVIVPAGKVADASLPVSVEVKPAGQGNFSAAAEGKDAKYYDISVSNLNDTNGKVKVTLQLDPGLTDVVIKHYVNSTVTVVPCTYNPVTGKVTFETESFSPLAIEYKCEKVAKIGNVYYSSLADAIAAVPNDGVEPTVITVLRDVKDAVGMAVSGGKNFIVDFAGHTYELNKPGAGSSGTETNGFQFLKGSTIVLKNGTITISEDNLVPVYNAQNKAVNIMRIIQNYSALTLLDMTIDGTNQYGGAGYVMSFNNDPVFILGKTNIIAAEGEVAFDADGNWGSYNRSRVTIDTTGTIVGNLELGSGYLDIKNANVKGGVVFCTSCGAAETEGQTDRLSITGGTFTVDPGHYVGPDYAVEADGNGYRVVEGILVSSAEEMTQALNNGVSIIRLNSVAGLKAMADEVNNNHNQFRGKTIKLDADIDLAGVAWEPVGNLVSYPGVTFAGTFDGQGHTISNMNVADSTVNHAAAGFFGSAAGATIQNVIFRNATVTSTHYAGVVVAYEGANSALTHITNVVVDGAAIVSSAEEINGEWDNGDKAGGIAGYATSLVIEHCTVKNASIKGYRDLGGIVGCADGTYHSAVNGCTVDNVTITVDKTHNYKNYTSCSEHNVGNFIGRNLNHTADTDNNGSVEVIY